MLVINAVSRMRMLFQSIAFISMLVYAIGIIDVAIAHPHSMEGCAALAALCISILIAEGYARYTLRANGKARVRIAGLNVVAAAIIILGTIAIYTALILIAG